MQTEIQKARSASHWRRPCSGAGCGGRAPTGHSLSSRDVKRPVCGSAVGKGQVADSLDGAFEYRAVLGTGQADRLAAPRLGLLAPPFRVPAAFARLPAELGE